MSRFSDSVPSRPLLPLIAALLFSGASGGATDFDLVNQLRAQAGLPALEYNEHLAGAAARHAAYLDRHREPGKAPHGLSAHGQQPGMTGFSGETPADRAVAAGYPHREVLENVSMGYDDASSAIQGLMSAIYHRLTFLDLEADQLGIAVGERSRVFLLGRSDIGAMCAAPPPAALHRNPVDCLGQSMTREYYEALCAALPPEALFQPSHPVTCPNGVRLDADFMAKVCEKPPREARFYGYGRYYAPCDNDTKVNADWFNALCKRPPADALYAASGSFYEICERPRRVHAEWLEAQCAALPDEARYQDSRRYRRPCAADLDVRVEYLDQLDTARRASLAEVVLWPPPDSVDIVPAFYVEEPDPLPDLQVAGYPVSIQFNPARVGEVQLQGFRLFRLEGESRVAVDGTRLLDQASDPNHLLTRFEFALFPLERLAWGARYVAVVDALLDGQPRHFEWPFTTAGGDAQLLTAAAGWQRFVVRSGVDYLLYLPPQDGRPHTVLTTRTEHRRGNQVTLRVVDPNTLRVRLQLRFCDQVKMEFDGGRVVELVPVGCGA